MTHTCNLLRWRREDQEFKVNLSYMAMYRDSILFPKVAELPFLGFQFLFKVSFICDTLSRSAHTSPSTVYVLAKEQQKGKRDNEVLFPFLSATGTEALGRALRQSCSLCTFSALPQAPPTRSRNLMSCPELEESIKVFSYDVF